MIERVVVHRLAKAPGVEHEYEDAAGGPVRHGSSVRLAIADGATESARAGDWAATLVDAACRRPLQEAILQARASFAGIAASDVETSPWYIEEKLAEGAHATILTIELWEGGTYQAEAIGDCVLFHLEAGGKGSSWPITDPGEFGNQPPLVASILSAPIPQIQTVHGSWGGGDRMLLATDALAAHMLVHPPREFCDLASNEFEEHVTRARRTGLRNDDVTLIEILLR